MLASTLAFINADDPSYKNVESRLLFRAFLPIFINVCSREKNAEIPEILPVLTYCISNASC